MTALTAAKVRSRVRLSRRQNTLGQLLAIIWEAIRCPLPLQLLDHAREGSWHRAHTLGRSIMRFQHAHTRSSTKRVPPRARLEQSLVQVIARALIHQHTSPLKDNMWLRAKARAPAVTISLKIALNQLKRGAGEGGVMQ